MLGRKHRSKRFSLFVVVVALLSPSLLFLVSCSSHREEGLANRGSSESLSPVDNIHTLPPKMQQESSRLKRSYLPPSKRGNSRQYVVAGKRYYPHPYPIGYKERGIASWYGKKFHGRLTSSGERYNMYTYTAAHRTVLLPSYAKVTNLKNQRSVIVRINDRGPFHKNRVIDLSYAAANSLRMTKSGVQEVEIEFLAVANPGKQGAFTKTKANPSAKNYRYLQCGSFQILANAKKSLYRLKQIALKGHIVPHAVREDIFYRVVLGPFSSERQGSRVKKYLKRRGFPDVIGLTHLTSS